MSFSPSKMSTPLPRHAPQRHGLHLPLGAGVGASVVGRSAPVGSGGGREGRMGEGRRGESRGVGGRRVDERDDGLGVAWEEDFFPLTN